MTVLPCANRRYWFEGGYQLNITLRYIDAAPYAELEIMTVKLWLYLAKQIESGVRTLPEQIAYRSPEMTIEQKSIEESNGTGGYKFEPFVETRCAVFDWNNKLNLTVHSDSIPQHILDIWWAAQDAEVAMVGLIQNAAQSNVAPTNSSAPAQPPMSRPNTPETPQNTDYKQVGGKKAAKELSHNTKFMMPIAKIAAVMSPEGKLKWELYGFYGSNPGKFADLVIYSDNENSIRNGLNAALTTLVSKPGQSVTGKWFAKGKVIEKDDKKSIYTNLLFDESQTLLNEKGDSHPGMEELIGDEA